MIAFFSHPDCTVGFGISPNQPPKRLADFTAGWESHPAPKKYIIIFYPSDYPSDQDLVYTLRLYMSTVTLVGAASFLNPE